MAPNARAHRPALTNLLRPWPLSSVGVAALAASPVESFWSDASLRQIYVDRVIARADLARLAEPGVRAAARAALGLYPALAPAVAQELARD